MKYRLSEDTRNRDAERYSKFISFLYCSKLGEFFYIGGAFNLEAVRDMDIIGRPIPIIWVARVRNGFVAMADGEMEYSTKEYCFFPKEKSPFFPNGERYFEHDMLAELSGYKPEIHDDWIWQIKSGKYNQENAKYEEYGRLATDEMADLKKLLNGERNKIEYNASCDGYTLVKLDETGVIDPDFIIWGLRWLIEDDDKIIAVFPDRKPISLLKKKIGCSAISPAR